MKAVVQERYGSPDVLEVRDVDAPVPGDGQVLVRVRAAGVNAYDWHLMRGDPYVARLALGVRAPRARIRGRDFAGEVTAVGPNVLGLRPGDEVFGEVDGTFAEYVCVPDAWVERKPASLTFEQAAALPLAGTTALRGLRDIGQLRAGQHVLVNGASGGVGTFAVQVAKALGAEVTGVCSTRNVELVRSLGADHVVDYTLEDFTRKDSTRGGQRYDLVLDLVANHGISDLRRVLTPTGTLVLGGGGRPGQFLGAPVLILKGLLLSPFVRQRLRPLIGPAPDKAVLTALRELADAGQLAPVIDRTYPLSEAPEAIRYLEVEHARGKVVVTV
ncbi:NAD(P)-dependent alcohol dehydrogenase [Streptomyces graminilatus]|uniref:NAD(P)-dependent alcohol dehydrogenase n=1 Tax=Streptomyces graminilatus TaxID=1464070 RepID=UPI0006E247AA|nr:NAD(P)-dependent alcohol dehydrogenase [Streptomyces graminilatus]